MTAQRRVVGGSEAASVPSPCTDVCRIDPVSGWCEGCLRTLDEIAAWGGIDDARPARDLEAAARAPPGPGRCARRGLRSGRRRDEGDRLLVRPGVAVRPPGVPAPARGAGRACRTASPTGRSCSPHCSSTGATRVRPRSSRSAPGPSARSTGWPIARACGSRRRRAIRSIRSPSRGWPGRRAGTGATPSRLRLRKHPRPCLAGGRRRCRGSGAARRAARAARAAGRPGGASAAKQMLRQATDAALARGVFGVPTLEVDGRLFWGLDALADAGRLPARRPVVRGSRLAASPARPGPASSARAWPQALGRARQKKPRSRERGRCGRTGRRVRRPSGPDSARARPGPACPCAAGRSAG